MKKIFITGANGFIGKNLCEGLEGQYDIFSPSRNELNLLNELDVKEYLKKNNFDVIIHCATQNASRNAKEPLNLVLERNLRMFFNLERCSDYYGKMYYLGSGAEYDMENYIPFMNEEYFGKHIPKDGYGFSKYVMSKISENKNNIYDLRLFGVYGKYEDWEIRFISNAICKSMYNLPITIKQNVYFDYLYIDDFIKIMKWFIENSPQCKQYNITTSNHIDLVSIAKVIRKESGKDLSIIVKKEGLKKEYSGNNERLLKEIGGFAFSKLEDNIKKLILYYSSIKNDIDINKLKYDK